MKQIVSLKKIFLILFFLIFSYFNISFAQNDFYYIHNKKNQLSKKLDQYAVKFYDEIADDIKLEIFSLNNLNLLIDKTISNLYLIKTFTNDVDIKKSIEKIPEIEFVSYSFITENVYTVYLSN